MSVGGMHDIALGDHAFDARAVGRHDQRPDAEHREPVESGHNRGIGPNRLDITTLGLQQVFDAHAPRLPVADGFDMSILRPSLPDDKRKGMRKEIERGGGTFRATGIDWGTDMLYADGVVG